MSLYMDDDFEMLRTILSWGSKGKDGTQDMQFIPLCNMENSHITAILNLGFSSGVYSELFRKELEYRKDHKIKDVKRTAKLDKNS